MEREQVQAVAQDCDRETVVLITDRSNEKVVEGVCANNFYRFTIHEVDCSTREEVHQVEVTRKVKLERPFQFWVTPDRQFGCVTVTQLGFGGAEDDDVKTDTGVSVLRLKAPRPR